MPVIVFDLDDTLFDSLEYVRSGMRAVAATFGAEKHQVYQELLHELDRDRNGVFDRFLKKRGLFSKKRVQKLLQLYRSHEPQISLFPEAIHCLNRLKKYPLYIITDGNQRVQRKKYEALNLKRWIKRCLCTYAFGLHRSKPSTYCFEKIARIEKVSPKEIVYIADNPHKDFVGLKKAGFKTIRVLTGPFKDLKLDRSHESEKVIESLNELSCLVDNLSF